MGNKLRDEDLNLNIIVNGDKGKKELGDLEKSTRTLIERNKELRLEKEKLIRAGKQESDEFKAVTKEITANNAALKSNETRMTELRKAIGLTGLTMGQLRSEQTRLKRLMDSSTYGTEQWRKYRAELDKVEAQMGKVRTGSVKLQSGISKMAEGASKYAALAVGAIAAITSIYYAARKVIEPLIKLSDDLADVMKTTGLSRREVAGLYKDFDKLNTRTPREELLKLAEEAGRLGITGRKNILAFVEVANKIKVALGDDLGGDAEQAIKEVGKLTEIFNVGEQYGTGFKESMEKIGSGINTVANSSNASAEYLIEYMKRLGGVSDQAKISAADIMGYAATLDELGQNVELSATAQGKLIVDMFTEPAKYARIAKMEVGQFSQLLKTDANEAFIKFLEGLNGNNEGLTEMAAKLDGLGIDGARAVQVLATLSANTDKLKQQQELANDAMAKGTSLSDEYRIKNNNLAGSFGKLGDFIKAAFSSSGLLELMERFIGKMAKMTEVIHPLTVAMQDEISLVNLLAIELTNTNTPAERRNEIYKQLKEYAPDVIANIDAENVSLETLRGNLEKYNAEMIKKLALQDSEETLSDKREAAGKATNERIENELKLMKEMNSLLQTYKTFDPNIAKKMEAILFSNETPLNKYKKMVKEVGLVDFSPKTSVALTESLRDEKKATDEVNESLQAYMERYKMVFGEDKPTVTPAMVAPPVATTVVTPLNLKDTGTASSAIDVAQAKEILRLKQYYADKEQLEKEYKARLLASELAYLRIKESLEPDQLKKIELQSQIIDKQKEYTSALKEAVPEILNNSDGIQQLNKRLFEESKLLNLAAKSQAKGAAEQQEYTAAQLQQAETIQMMGDIMTDYVTGALNGSIDEFQTFGDTLILMSLQMLKQMVPIWAAWILGQALVTPDSIATLGASGVAKAAVVSGIMYAAIAAAEGAVKSGINKKREAASGNKTKGYASGGYALEETYRVAEKGPEFIASNPAVRNPEVKQFLDIFDYYQRTGQISKLNTKMILANLPVQQMYVGGYSNSPSTRYAAQGTLLPERAAVEGSDPALTDAINLNTKAIAMLMKRGVQFPMVAGLKKMKDLDDLLSQTGMGGFNNS